MSGEGLRESPGNDEGMRRVKLGALKILGWGGDRGVSLAAVGYTVGYRGRVGIFHLELEFRLLSGRGR